jgi:aspartyl-tRNA(Asn)/glutamyl-tRNA(Gln) amidotransferase subunit B
MERQITLYTNHPNQPFHELIPPSTYRWDQSLKKTVLMRKKESLADYRYFPEPDLGPIVISESWIKTLTSNFPELPQKRYERYINTLGLTEYAASLLVNDKPLSDYFEEALLECPFPKTLCNWITVEFVGRLKNSGKTLQSIALPPTHVAKLVRLIEEKKVTGPIAKAIADEMILSPSTDPDTIISQNPNYQPMDSQKDLDPIIDTVLKENEESILAFKAGKERAFGYLVGQVMKKTGGKASPEIVNALLRKKLFPN